RTHLQPTPPPIHRPPHLPRRALHHHHQPHPRLPRPTHHLPDQLLPHARRLRPPDTARARGGQKGKSRRAAGHLPGRALRPSRPLRRAEGGERAQTRRRAEGRT
ncbi:hypothetical protein LTR28_003056, partial [Elasticomyces elasticus]